MTNFILTSEENGALDAIMSRYHPYDEEEHHRRKYDQTFIGWLYIPAYVSFGYPDIKWGPLEWFFKSPDEAWKVRGKFIRHLIECANGTHENMHQIDSNIWPTPEVLNGDPLCINDLSVTDEIKVENIQPTTPSQVLSMSFENVIMEHIVVSNCIFGNVDFYNCVAQSISVPKVN
ncbi:MAG: hypothetical protein COA43_04905 [Robiginitomaculum sp.]|nr:MAG: hypothetical protein COA43_04905 [Robiginitomaculum sp.]